MITGKNSNFYRDRYLLIKASKTRPRRSKEPTKVSNNGSLFVGAFALVTVRKIFPELLPANAISRILTHMSLRVRQTLLGLIIVAMTGYLASYFLGSGEFALEACFRSPNAQKVGITEGSSGRPAGWSWKPIGVKCDYWLYDGSTHRYERRVVFPW